MKGRRQWHPTPVLLPGKSHGRRSLVGYSPWGRKELDSTEQHHFHALEKKMATHSSIVAWRIPGTGAWWAAIYEVAQSRTRLKLHSSRQSIGASASVHGVAKSQTQLSDFTFTFHFYVLEKKIATHSSIVAWRIPGTGAWWAAIYGVTQSWT